MKEYKDGLFDIWSGYVYVYVYVCVYVAVFGSSQQIFVEQEQITSL